MKIRLTIILCVVLPWLALARHICAAQLDSLRWTVTEVGMGNIVTREVTGTIRRRRSRCAFPARC